jgi:hypothetical protein
VCRNDAGDPAALVVNVMNPDNSPKYVGVINSAAVADAAFAAELSTEGQDVFQWIKAFGASEAMELFTGISVIGTVSTGASDNDGRRVIIGFTTNIDG